MFYIGDSTREQRARKRRDLETSDFLHPDFKYSHPDFSSFKLDNYINDLNNRIEAFETSCFVDI